MKKVEIKKGDYVLATKWHDGDPMDHFVVGFYDREESGRHYVVDAEGNQFRRNGFRRVSKIDRERGHWFVINAKEIEFAGRSIWSLKRNYKKLKDFFL